VRFSYTAGQLALREELVAYYDHLLDHDTCAALRDSAVGDVMRQVVKQMAADGWLGLGWPVEFGGKGRGPVEQYIFFDESARAGAPLPVISVNLIGPTLMQHGTPEQQAEHLPAITRGESFFCIGYSEPEAGTDLAAINTTAVLDGDHYVINGFKTWTSYYSCATHIWLAVRTDPAATRHAGMSLLIVPMDAPGITTTALNLLNDHDIASVRFDDVRVPVTSRVGAEHGGWAVITSQLNHERTTMGAPGAVSIVFDEVRAWAARILRPDGSRLIEATGVQTALARGYAALETMRLRTWSNVDDVVHGRTNVANISTTKVASTEGLLTVLTLLQEIVGSESAVGFDDEAAELFARLDLLHRHHLALTFGGGANEVQRELVATAGLGLPRSR
jgi:alkylation response protein AidB-like acyl-CoA dehydrogenase